MSQHGRSVTGKTTESDAQAAPAGQPLRTGRPTEHGGGQAAPAIAGDPGSFPPDAELARTLVATQGRGALCTLTAAGYPYGSAVSHAVAADGAPVLLLSELAEHTVNARTDARASLLVTAQAAPGADPLSTARATLVGRLHLVTEPAAPAAHRSAYLERHPYAAYYADFTDFGFWRLEVEQCRFVGGFGHMSWVTGADYHAAAADPLAAAAGDIISHMNDDHADANLSYARGLAGLDDATAAVMVGVDRYGVTLRVQTPPGPRLARLPFPTPVTGPDQARPALIELLQAARTALAAESPATPAAASTHEPP